MSDKIEDGMTVLKSHLTLLPAHFSHVLLDRIQQCIHYEPVIGIMGKTGVGKSSLCNALFKQPLSPVSHSEGCTRTPLRFTLEAGHRQLTLIDLPGAGESQAYDVEYQQLYKNQLPELDLILWVMKADDRACATDEAFYQFLLDCGVDPQRMVFVLNQADKAEPSLEWDRERNQPSAQQSETLTQRCDAIAHQFSCVNPVYAVSAATAYNLTCLVEAVILALPREASSGVFRQVKEEHRTQDAETVARNDFGEWVGELIWHLADVLPLPRLIREGLSVVRDGIVCAAKALWHWFF
ncbi:GTP-binding protein [Plesiomonas shigelloides]|nr:GTP-binding protein [Plesiomonas shigelloides]